MEGKSRKLWALSQFAFVKAVVQNGICLSACSFCANMHICACLPVQCTECINICIMQLHIDSFSAQQSFPLLHSQVAHCSSHWTNMQIDAHSCSYLHLANTNIQIFSLGKICLDILTTLPPPSISFTAGV